MEVWKDIEGCPDYQVSSIGRIRHIRILPTWTDGDGYLKTTVQKKHVSIARLVGKTFIPNPDDKPQIDHINRIRTDNRVENLRWATPSENNTNREHKLSASGHRYIYMNPEGTYRVHIKYDGTTFYRKTYKTFEEAIVVRDEIISSLRLPGEP